MELQGTFNSQAILKKKNKIRGLILAGFQNGLQTIEVQTVVMVSCFLDAMSWTAFLCHTYLCYSASPRTQNFRIGQPWIEPLKSSGFWQVQHWGGVHLAKSFILNHPMAEGRKAREGERGLLPASLQLSCRVVGGALLFSFSPPSATLNKPIGTIDIEYCINPELYCISHEFTIVLWSIGLFPGRCIPQALTYIFYIWMC